MSAPKPGEVRPVQGSHGLMLVVTVVEGANGYVCGMRGHGPPKGEQWFYARRLGEPVEAREILEERKKARVRRADCNSPGCWCRKVEG